MKNVCKQISPIIVGTETEKMGVQLVLVLPGKVVAVAGKALFIKEVVFEPGFMRQKSWKGPQE